MPDLLARFQPWRRWFESGFWVVVLTVQAIANSLVSWIDRAGTAQAVPYWQPLVWEASSALAIGALIPLLLLVAERRFPVNLRTWRRHLPVHLGFTLVFCLLHVGGMVALRQGLYALAGQAYTVADWPRMFFYEYLKDVRTYVMLLVAFWSYRLVLMRLQGEARVLDPPEPPPGAAGPTPGPDPVPPAPPSRPERFLVRKLRKEFLIAAADIEWLQAQGNYVGLHVNGHDYLLRSTLSEFLEQLDPARFTRVHRSYAVNLDRIAEIEPLDAGDAKLKMKDGTHVPCSRRYRDALAR